MVIERGEGLSAPGVDHRQETVLLGLRAVADRAASVPTGAIGTPRACASPRAVAIPIRSPVKEPGPIPTAIRSTDSQPPPASTQRSISASSPCE